MPTSIVTGGAGFVGSNLAAALQARGHHVIVVDPFRSGSFANLNEACARLNAGPFRGEVLPLSSRQLRWGEGFPGPVKPAAVFHLGAITDTTLADEGEMLRENVEGFEPMLRWAFLHHVPLVYASSAATYGTPPQARDRTPFPEDAAGLPSNVYGFSKWMMEQVHHRVWLEHSRESPVYAVDPHARVGPHVVGLRFFNVFGPGESRKGKMASMVFQLAWQMLAGKSPSLFRDGSQARDQVYIDDVVECTLKAAEPDAKPGVYNLGSGRATSFNEIVEAIRRGLGIASLSPAGFQSDLGHSGPGRTTYIDMPASIRAFYQDYTCADLTRTRAGLRWEPRHEPLDAVAAYARYLREHIPR